MTTLLHFCHSQQSARLVLRPESWRAVPTSPCGSPVSASSPLVGIAFQGWTETIACSRLVPVLFIGGQGALEGIKCPWEDRSQLPSPEQPPLLPPHPLSSTLPSWKGAEAETEASEKQHHGVSLRAWSASYLQGPAQNGNVGPPC